MMGFSDTKVVFNTVEATWPNLICIPFVCTYLCVGKSTRAEKITWKVRADRRELRVRLADPAEGEHVMSSAVRELPPSEGWSTCKDTHAKSNACS